MRSLAELKQLDIANGIDISCLQSDGKLQLRAALSIFERSSARLRARTAGGFDRPLQHILPRSRDGANLIVAAG